MLKGTKLYSILRNKCPRCHKGRFWSANNPIANVFNGMGQMQEHCEHCNLKFEREIGFWYGAMYVSYALGVAIFVIGWALTAILLPIFYGEDYTVFFQISLVVALIILFFPFNWWLSRLIWINFFVRFEEKYEN